MTRRRAAPSGRVHLVLALADHFEPAVDPLPMHDGRVSEKEQEQRLEAWCREYPQMASPFRDNDGHPFVHTYFYPAEQYDVGLIDRLAEHCQSGWGEIEIHLHHGIRSPDTAENTKRVLTQFRDLLAHRHGCLSYAADSDTPRYAFVHGNFALANSAWGRFCGVDSEMQVLAETGCFADMTLPAAPLHPAQTRKMNALYEPIAPLVKKGSHARGRDLTRGVAPQIFPILVQGPLLLDCARSGAIAGIENGSITPANPLSVRRLQLWKRAAIQVQGRPDWLFVKLHCHSMDPRQKEATRGETMRCFLQELIVGAEDRGEILHFVTCREMVNIILAACEGREGNPGMYRDYRFQRGRSVSARESVAGKSQSVMEG